MERMASSKECSSKRHPLKARASRGTLPVRVIAPGPWVEVSVLEAVHREVQHPRVVDEHVLGAVAVVDVPVHNQHLWGGRITVEIAEPRVLLDDATSTTLLTLNDTCKTPTTRTRAKPCLPPLTPTYPQFLN